MKPLAVTRTPLCIVAFRAWLAAGVLALAIPGAFGATTPAGSLAAWLVGMPLACLVLIEPCRACVAVLRVASLRTRLRPQARRLRRSAA
ncbi:MAG TPA: hypothetical protein VND91_06685 [Candidatus Saccharimonadia bacterium]|nr:hypothetical protein [Candidatus Saccharimonadia bacterium]